MKEIKLSQFGKNKGKFVALVDDEDFERVNQYRWCVYKNRRTFYAEGRVYIDGVSVIIQLHQFIMGIKGVDHIDHDGLNCQKYNMRPCTTQQNNWNRRPHINSSSKFKGVRWHSNNEKWEAQIYFNSKNKSLGYFRNEEDAAKAYDLKAKEVFGGFAFVNFKY